MKKIVPVLFAFVLFTFSCSGSDTTKNVSKDDKLMPANNPITVSTSVVNDGTPIHLNKQKFLLEIMDYEKNQTTWIYKGKLPGLVDFYADWCRPCKITSPILDELAKEYQGKIQIYKVNIDEEKELAAVFGVQSIPTFLFMPMSGNPTISAGIAQTPEQTKAMFKQQIDEILLNNNPSE